MMVRLLLVLIAVIGLSLGGCKKKEPTVGERLDQAVEKTEEAADDAADEVEEAVEEGQKAVEEAAK